MNSFDRIRTRNLGVPLLSGLLAACMLFDTGPRSPDPARGVVSLRLELERSRTLLAKSSSADTVFGLDSLVIVLSAPEADTITRRYALQGRADTGAIALPPLVMEDLEALRNWKARIYSIDMGESPPRRDTVHIDSVIFAVLPSDTTFVVKAVSPAFAILRARFLSSQADSIPANVLYLRLRVEGGTRDSLVLGGRNASLNWLQTMPGTVIYAAGDSGRFLRSVTDAVTDDDGAWQERVLTTNPLAGGYFTDHANGYVVSVTGQTFATTDSGKSWSGRASTPDSLSGAWFTDASTGFSIGRGGGIYKTVNTGNSWFTTVSNTPYRLNGISFPTAAVGYVVGENETILKTVNGTAGDAPPEFGGIVWSPVAGGWFTQTSNSSADLRDAHFITPDTGWVVGAGGTLRVTYNGGAVWSSRDQAGTHNAVTFTSPNRGWIVSDGGGIRAFVSEYDWRTVTSGTVQNLYDVRGLGSDTAYAVGAGGTLRRTINAGQAPAAPHNVTWSGQSIPAPGNPWVTKASGGAALHGLAFAGVSTGVAVGASGTLRRTADAGETWDARDAHLDGDLNAAAFADASTGVAVGADEGIARTTDAGDTWTALEAGWTPGTAGGDALRAVHFVGNTGWAVGAAGSVLTTANAGAGWTAQDGKVSGDLKGVHFVSADTGMAAGAGETLIRTANGGAAWDTLPHGWFGQASGISDTLRALRFVNAAAGWAVGDNGSIVKTVNGGADWDPQPSNKDKPLRAVQAYTTGKAVAVGDSGIVLRTVDGGASWNWTPGSAATTNQLNDVSALTSTYTWAVGNGGVLRRSPDSGSTWTSHTSGTPNHLNAVAVFSTTKMLAVGQGGVVVRSANPTVASPTFNLPSQTATNANLNGVALTSANVAYAVGDGGVIIRCNAGANTGWTLQTSNTNANLRRVWFKGTGTAADTGFVVGDGGVVLKTMNAGTTWIPLQSGTAEHLKALHFGAWSDTVYAVGGAGVVRKTLWGGHRSNKGSPQTLRGVHYLSASIAYAVGDSGTVLRSLNGGASWNALALNTATIQRFNAVFSISPRTWVVGDSGVRRTTSSTNSGPTWTTLANVPSGRLNGVHFTSTSIGVAVGDNGLIIKCTNSNNDNWAAKSAGLTNQNLLSVRFVDANTGYITGENGTLLKSTDAGENWIIQDPGTDEDLFGVHPLTPDTALAVGAAGATARTLTGGSWSGRATPHTFRGVAFNTATHGFAVGDAGVISRTSNGGVTWDALASGTTERLNAVHANSSRVWAVGENGAFRRSTNHSANPPTWNTPNNLIAGHYNGVHFTSSNIGIVVGDTGLIIKCSNSNNDNWAVKGQGKTREDLLSVHFTDASNGYIMGTNGVVLKTTDAGENWTLQETGAGQPLRAARALSSSNVVAAGGGGLILKTTVGGYQAGTTTLRSVHPVTSRIVYAAGDDGLIARTANAGETWSAQTTGTSADLRGIGFADANTGWAVGVGGVILRTVNGGSGWEEQDSPVSDSLNSIQVLSADTAYVSGAGGLMLKTVDGGATWYEQEIPVAHRLNSVYFLTRDYGFAVGANGTILNAVNQGDNWTGGGIKRSLKGVYFANADTGWIVGEDAVILKTENGGETWTEQHRDAGTTLYGIHFANATTGWATGENGLVLKTTDGGGEWIAQPTNTAVTLRWAHFRDANRGFIIGGTQSILETSDGGAAWSGLFVGVPGERAFDHLLTYKYLRPNRSQQVILDAMDRFSLPLRGYQAVLDLNVGAGQDSVISAPLTRCGYGGDVPDCVP